MEAQISLSKVAKAYKRGKESVEVLNEINFNIGAGEFIALMGPSGSGKTTLLNLIGGLDTPTAGEIRVDGQYLSGMSSLQLVKWRARHVGFIFQFYNLMPTLSAERNVELPLLLTHLNAAQRRRQVATALALVGLSDRAKHKPGELSGGQQQRVAIARAIVTKPDTLFADEPTGNLDSKTTVEIMELLRKLNTESGISIIMVTHEDEVAACARRIIHVRDGLISQDTGRESQS
jgi:putative ABC transport system ATP-binding protein